MKLDIGDLSVLLAVARHQSFRKAGDELGVSGSAVSHALSQLEARLQIRLVNRTTRSVALTAAGERLCARLNPAWLEITEALEELNDYRHKPVGVVRLNAVRAGARLALAPLLADFSREYPQIRVELTLDDRLVDIVADRFDGGIRLNAVLENDMVAIPLGPPVRYAVVGSPDYFTRHPIPERPEQLLDHQCIEFRYPSGRPFHWAFRQGETSREVAVRGGMVVNDLDLAQDLALRGAGLSYVLAQSVSDAVAEGRLCSVLEPWLPEIAGFHLYYPGKKHLSGAFRAFIDYLKAKN